MNDPVFFLTSALITEYSSIQPHTRFEQTLKSIESIKNKFQKPKIILLEMSTSNINKYWKDLLLQEVYVYFDFLQFNEIHIHYKSNNLHLIKNLNESFCLRKGIQLAQDLNLIQDTTRCFKLSGRYNLTEDFNVNDHANDGYTFLTARPSHFNNFICPEKMQFMCRLYSWNPIHTNDLINVLENTYNYISKIIDNKQYVDIEHSFYKFLNKSKVYETNKIGVEGQINQNYATFIKE